MTKNSILKMTNGQLKHFGIFSHSLYAYECIGSFHNDTCFIDLFEISIYLILKIIWAYYLHIFYLRVKFNSENSSLLCF